MLIKAYSLLLIEVINSRGQFAYYQYIKGDIIWFCRLREGGGGGGGWIEVHLIDKGIKWNMPYLLISTTCHSSLKGNNYNSIYHVS